MSQVPSTAAPASADLKCPKCGAIMVLRQSVRMRYDNGQPRKFYGCIRFPDCHAAHGAHPDGRPVGIPGDDETCRARVAAHALFDRLWKPELGGTRPRRRAYEVLQHVMGMSRDEAHIGRFTKEQCEALIALLDVRFSRAGGDR